LRWQRTETCEPTPESIWEEIDMLEGDPAHMGVAMGNARFKPCGSRQKPRSGKDILIKASSRNESAQTFSKLVSIVFLLADTEQVRLQNQEIHQNWSRLSLRGTTYLTRFRDGKGKDYD
jgi:hypothetical protein